MNAIERLLSCKGNPVEFFELVEAARAEVDALRAKTANDAFVIHALRGVEGERDALKGALKIIAATPSHYITAYEKEMKRIAIEALEAQKGQEKQIPLNVNPDTRQSAGTPEIKLHVNGTVDGILCPHCGKVNYPRDVANKLRLVVCDCGTVSI